MQRFLTNEQTLVNEVSDACLVRDVAMNMLNVKMVMLKSRENSNGFLTTWLNRHAQSNVYYSPPVSRITLIYNFQFFSKWSLETGPTEPLFFMMLHHLRRVCAMRGIFGDHPNSHFMLDL